MREFFARVRMTVLLPVILIGLFVCMVLDGPEDEESDKCITALPLGKSLNIGFTIRCEPDR